MIYFKDKGIFPQSQYNKGELSFCAKINCSSALRTNGFAVRYRWALINDETASKHFAI